MTRKTDLTYKGYLKKLHIAKDISDKESIQKTLLQLEPSFTTNNLFPSTSAKFVIDYIKSQYIFFSNSLGNYHPQQILEGGLEFMIPLMPKDFFNTYNEKIFPAILSFLKQVPAGQSHP